MTSSDSTRSPSVTAPTTPRLVLSVLIVGGAVVFEVWRLVVNYRLMASTTQFVDDMFVAALGTIVGVTLYVSSPERSKVRASVATMMGFWLIYCLIVTMPNRYSHKFDFAPKFQVMGATGASIVLMVAFAKVVSVSWKPTAEEEVVLEPEHSLAAHALAPSPSGPPSALGQRVASAQFRLAWKGYDVDEVDAYLEDVVARLSPAPAGTNDTSSASFNAPLDERPTPMELRQKQFKTALKGYAVADVDTFLEQIANEVS